MTGRGAYEPILAYALRSISQEHVDVTAPTYRSKRPEIGPWTLAVLAQAHAAANYPGRFEVRRNGDQNDVVAVQVADRGGQLRNLTPLLDLTVRAESRLRLRPMLVKPVQHVKRPRDLVAGPA
jgi:hypothetical protein